MSFGKLPTLRRPRPSSKPTYAAGQLAGLCAFLDSYLPRTFCPATATVPAGFTNDGLPVGVDLLGRTLDGARLVSVGYAFEQGTHHRRPPVLTPPLSADPEPTAVRFTVLGDNFESEFTLDLVRNLIEYDLSVTSTRPEDLYAVTLHRRGESGDGPVIQQLVGPGRLGAAGTFVLSLAEREALEEGRLYVQVYTKNETMGGRALPLAWSARLLGLPPQLAAAGIEANFESEGVEHRLGAEPHTVDDYLNRISESGFRIRSQQVFRGDSELIRKIGWAEKYRGRPLLLLIDATSDRRHPGRALTSGPNSKKGRQVLAPNANTDCPKPSTASPHPPWQPSSWRPNTP